MSRIFGQNIDLNKNEAKNFRFGNELTYPTLTEPDKGFVFFHSPNKKFYGWDGTVWKELGATGGGASDGVVSNVELTGTNLTFTGSGGGFNGVIDLSTISDISVINNLISTSTTDALSAAQGKVLQDNKAEDSAVIHNTGNESGIAGLKEFNSPVRSLSSFQLGIEAASGYSLGGSIGYIAADQYFFAKQGEGRGAIFDFTSLSHGAIDRTYTFPNVSGEVLVESSGTFTPTITNLTGVSATSAIGTYIRQGNLVHIDINITGCSGTTTASSWSVGGLPFNTLAGYFTPINMFVFGTNATFSNLQATMTGSASLSASARNSDNTQYSWNGVTFTSGIIRINGTYKTS